MHVILVILGGLLSLGLFLLFGYLWGGAPGGPRTGALAFMPAWIAIAVVNLWVGVTKAGYTVREELPILCLVAAVPIAVSALYLWSTRS